ncbi:MAG: nucleotidyltransferase domain-containing protein [Thermovirgaceae bacterium]|nr:nucleotidyltransferase domain-containing protein [Thermovirgaceae bacterium]
MSVDESLIREIVSRIVSVSKPEKVILFGSAATGGMTPDSDIDLLVVSKEPVDSRKQRNLLVRSLWGLGYPFDVIVISDRWFEESKNVIGGIAYPANKYGRVIYEAA